MATDRVALVESALDVALAVDAPDVPQMSPDAPIVPGSSLTAGAAFTLFEDQVRSRVLDVVARELKARGEGFYTISSAGHENAAVVGSLLRPTDPAFLHYRSGALVMARARQMDEDPLYDTLLSFCASSEDRVSGGRHKVWGSPSGWIPPQTSTIASHLPKAVGAAFAIGRAGRVGIDLPVPDDSVIVCTFGDASTNHATSLAAVNAARWARRRGSPVPILFVCEDNGLGISVSTPDGWIEQTFSSMPGLEYRRADGELEQVWEVAQDAVETCRTLRAPVFLHLPTIRLWGHAGTDVESAYRSTEEITRSEAQDPLLRNARRLIALGVATPQRLRELVEGTRATARALAEKAAAAPRLSSAEEVIAPLAPYDEATVRAESAARVSDADRRAEVFGATLPENVTAPLKRTMAALINAGLKDEMIRRPEVLVFGEDVARKGGVYFLTSGLLDAFGSARVFDTLLDETTILGIAQGAGLLGYLPVPEIQYLAYVHNALDQLRGEACSLAFFSDGQYRNPMVVRIAGLAYQKGFGGHFHNDNSVGALRDIPGLILAVPSRGDDAVRMLRGCLATAAAHGRVVAFLEPIALYHERDLYEQGDNGWVSDYPAEGDLLLPGDIGVHRPDAQDVVILTYGNGVRMSLRAVRRLSHAGIEARVVDLRWLNPLPHGVVRDQVAGCRALVIVDEARTTGGGVADELLSRLTLAGIRQPARIVTARDTYIPLGPAADLVLISEDDIVGAVEQVHAEVCAADAARPGSDR